MTSSDKPSAELIPTVTQPSLKFSDPQITANGEARASVSLQALNTLWLNTGTLCNLACESCYIESSPKNDALVYLSRSEVAQYLDEIVALELPVKQIGITGGEPFMNPDIIDIVDDCLSAGHQVLLLTNAMRPMPGRQTVASAMCTGGTTQTASRAWSGRSMAASHGCAPASRRPMVAGVA